MYTIDNMNAMSRKQLVDVINDAERCLLQIQQILESQDKLKNQKSQLNSRCDSLKRRIKGLPFIPGIIALVVLSLFSKWFLIFLVAAIVFAVLYKKKKKPEWEEQVSNIEKKQIPSLETQIVRSNEQLNSIRAWTVNVKSLLALLPENLRNLSALRGIREQLMQGAPNWFSALQAYQSLLREEERDRQLREMQTNVQRMSANTERTAAAVENVRKHAEGIERNTARTAAAAESAAYNSKRAAAAAENSARINAQMAQTAERAAQATERTARASERAASAAEEAAYWIWLNS